jgi:hypothetical protein
MGREISSRAEGMKFGERPNTAAGGSFLWYPPPKGGEAFVNMGASPSSNSELGS